MRKANYMYMRKLYAYAQTIYIYANYIHIRKLLPSIGANYSICYFSARLAST